MNLQCKVNTNFPAVSSLEMSFKVSNNSNNCCLTRLTQILVEYHKLNNYLVIRELCWLNGNCFGLSFKRLWFISHSLPVTFCLLTVQRQYFKALQKCGSCWSQFYQARQQNMVRLRKESEDESIMNQVCKEIRGPTVTGFPWKTFPNFSQENNEQNSMFCYATIGAYIGAYIYIYIYTRVYIYIQIYTHTYYIGVVEQVCLWHWVYVLYWIFIHILYTHTHFTHSDILYL